MAINPEEIKNLKQAQDELRKLNLEYQKLTGKPLFDNVADNLKTAKSQVEVFGKVVNSARRESAGLASVFVTSFPALNPCLGSLVSNLAEPTSLNCSGSNKI